MYRDLDKPLLRLGVGILLAVGTAALAPSSVEASQSENITVQDAGRRMTQRMEYYYIAKGETAGVILIRDAKGISAALNEAIIRNDTDPAINGTLSSLGSGIRALSDASRPNRYP